MHLDHKQEAKTEPQIATFQEYGEEEEPATETETTSKRDWWKTKRKWHHKSQGEKVFQEGSDAFCVMLKEHVW